MTNKLDDAYANYFGLKTVKDRINKQLEIPRSMWFNIYENEKKMLANLISSSIDTDNIVEFSRAFYIDDEKKLIIPTISEKFAIDNKTATLISPHLETSSKGQIKTIETSQNNPFHSYTEYLTTSLINDAKKAKCFVTEENFLRLFEHYKTLAFTGVPCVFAIASIMNKEFKDKTNMITKRFEDETKDNKLSYKVAFDFDTKTNSAAKIYILTKESK